MRSRHQGRRLDRWGLALWRTLWCLGAQGIIMLGDCAAARHHVTRAARLYRRARQMLARFAGPAHPSTLLAAQLLAACCHACGHLAEEESLWKDAIAVREAHLGPDHPDVAWSLDALATRYCEQGRYREAEPLYHRALQILERAGGREGWQLTFPLDRLAAFYAAVENIPLAEALSVRGWTIAQRTLGERHPVTVAFQRRLDHLAGFSVPRCPGYPDRGQNLDGSLAQMQTFRYNGKQLE